jgi:PadR family transcriptional regulator PadR
VKNTIHRQMVMNAFAKLGRTYGYDIAKETGLRSGTIYPILARLEQAGIIRSDWETNEAHDAGRPRRRYYELV